MHAPLYLLPERNPKTKRGAENTSFAFATAPAKCATDVSSFVTNFRSLTLAIMNIGVADIPVPQKVAYLRTLPAIRQRCLQVHELAVGDNLEYFEYHPEKEADVIRYCASIIKVPSLIAKPI